MLVLSTQMFPGILFLLPLFLIFVKIQDVLGISMTGSYKGLIITYLTFSLPFAIWMLTGYLSSLPGAGGGRAGRRHRSARSPDPGRDPRREARDRGGRGVLAHHFLG